MPLWKRLIPLQAKLWGRGKATAILGIPWNRYGISIPLAAHIPPGSPITLIDVGASQGHFTRSLDRYCGVRGTLLIEPQPQRAKECQAAFPRPGFTCICAAASDRSGFIEMEVLNWDYSSSILPVRRDLKEVSEVLDLGVRERITVECDTLDNLCRKAAMSGPVDLLKIDVQGAEHQVILGATETLRRTRLIWMELSLQPLYEGSLTIEPMIHLCRKHGFILKHLEEGFRSSINELLQVDALFVHN